ncbi:MAG: ATP-dependent DNA helicase RecG [Lentimonas sp.]|jgi:ATP-dependent DNA helicase RecG
MIAIVKISDDEKRKLLGTDEGHFSDHKAIEVAPGKLTKAIAAFANAEGGELFIGIDDDPRTWRGFENIESANAHIQVFDELFPLGGDFQYDFLSNGNAQGLVLKIQVAKTRDLKVASNGKVFQLPMEKDCNHYVVTKA